jgi:hypothetical protein
MMPSAMRRIDTAPVSKPAVQQRIKGFTDMLNANGSKGRRRRYVAVAGTAAAIVLSGCDGSSDGRSEGSAPTTGQSGSPSTVEAVSETSKALAPGDREVYELTGFLSPSRNIGCLIGPGGVGCEVRERDWVEPPRPADCNLDFETIFVGPGKPARFLCKGDSSYDASAPPLAYGDAITAGPIRCESVESGVTCRNVESGQGFSVSREAYQLF